MAVKFDAAVSGRAAYAEYSYFFCGSDYVRYCWTDPLGVDPDQTRPIRDGWKNLPEPFATRLDAAITGTGPFDGLALMFRDAAFAVCRWDDAGTVEGVHELAALGLPPPFDQRIDAALEAHGSREGRALLFHDAQFIEYEFGSGTIGDARPTSDLGLPAEFSSPDAAVDGRVSRVGHGYLFVGTKYVRYDWSTSRESFGAVSPGRYPADIAQMNARRGYRSWPGMGGPSTAATGHRFALPVGFIDPHAPGWYRGAVYFDSGSSTVRAADLPALNRVVDAENDLQRHHRDHMPVQWELVGFADPRTYSGLGGNEQLSANRAGSVRRYWGERMPPLPLDGDALDPDRDQVDGLEITISGRGVDPQASGLTGSAETLAFFRRVEVHGAAILHTGTTTRPPAPPATTSSAWEAMIADGLSVPIPDPLSIGPGVEVFETYLRAAPGGDPIGGFRFVGGSVGIGGGFVRQTTWVPGRGSVTSHKLLDFEGVALHAFGKFVQPAGSAQVEVLAPRYLDGTRGHFPYFVWSDAAWITSIEFPDNLDDAIGMLSAGASIGFGHLQLMHTGLVP